MSLFSGLRSGIDAELLGPVYYGTAVLRNVESFSTNDTALCHSGLEF